MILLVNPGRPRPTPGPLVVCASLQAERLLHVCTYASTCPALNRSRILIVYERDTLSNSCLLSDAQSSQVTFLAMAYILTYSYGMQDHTNTRG